MKKIVGLVILLLAIGSFSFAQKTINDPNAEKRTVGNFHGIDVATGIELVLTHGSTQEVVVSASETEFRDKIVSKVENGILKLHYETKTGAINKKKETKNLKAYVSYTTLDQLNVTTGAEVQIMGKLESGSLKMNVNTGGEVKGEISGGNLSVDQGTGSKVTLSGKAEKLEVKGDTGSKFLGESLTVNNCDVDVSTGAGVVVSVDKIINVKANTGGYLKYKGNAGIKEIKTNTGGTVSRI